MKRWATSVLTKGDVRQMLTMPKREAESRDLLRRDVSMLCLFDHDLSTCPAIVSCKNVKHSGIYLNEFHSRDAGSSWNGAIELLGEGNIKNGAEIKPVIERNAFVLYGPRDGEMILCWYILRTMRGCVALEVLVRENETVNTSEVICCRRTDLNYGSGSEKGWCQLADLQREKKLDRLEGNEIDWVWDMKANKGTISPWLKNGGFERMIKQVFPSYSSVED